MHIIDVFYADNCSSFTLYFVFNAIIRLLKMVITLTNDLSARVTRKQLDLMANRPQLYPVLHIQAIQTSSLSPKTTCLQISWRKDNIP